MLRERTQTSQVPPSRGSRQRSFGPSFHSFTEKRRLVCGLQVNNLRRANPVWSHVRFPRGASDVNSTVLSLADGPGRDRARESRRSPVPRPFLFLPDPTTCVGSCPAPPYPDFSTPSLRLYFVGFPCDLRRTESLSRLSVSSSYFRRAGLERRLTGAAASGTVGPVTPATFGGTRRPGVHPEWESKDGPWVVGTLVPRARPEGPSFPEGPGSVSTPAYWERGGARPLPTAEIGKGPSSVAALLWTQSPLPPPRPTGPGAGGPAPK